jgi:hypothetical protein
MMHSLARRSIGYRRPDAVWSPAFVGFGKTGHLERDRTARREGALLISRFGHGVRMGVYLAFGENGAPVTNPLKMDRSVCLHGLGIVQDWGRSNSTWRNGLGFRTRASIISENFLSFVSMSARQGLALSGCLIWSRSFLRAPRHLQACLILKHPLPQIDV